MKTLETNRLNGQNGNIGKPISLPAMNIKTVDVPIYGVTPLMVLRFSEKARNMMLAKQMGEAKAGKVNKEPLALFKEAAYRDEDGFIFPSVCFKAAAVACANDIEMKQTEMRRAFHVCGEYVRIEAPAITKPVTEWDEKFKKDLVWEHKHGCSMRCDSVRLASGVADLRFRAWFPQWQTVLRIDYNESIISLEQLLMLYTVAGFGNGVGEWRPGSKESKTGTYGRWKLNQD